MLCREIMKRHVHCVSPNDTAQSVARTMLDENVGFLPICEDSGKPIGTITDRDLALRLVAGGMAHTTRIAEIMTGEVVSCHPHDEVSEAGKRMAEHHKSRIMCVDGDGRLVGVISLSDLAEKDRRHAVDTLAEVSSRETHT